MNQYAGHNIIIAESNFLQEFIYEVYKNKRPIDDLELRTISKRLQSIRDEARKYGEKIQV